MEIVEYIGMFLDKYLIGTSYNSLAYEGVVTGYVNRDSQSSSFLENVVLMKAKEKGNSSKIHGHSSTLSVRVNGRSEQVSLDDDRRAKGETVLAFIRRVLPGCSKDEAKKALKSYRHR